MARERLDPARAPGEHGKVSLMRSQSPAGRAHHIVRSMCDTQNLRTKLRRTES